MIPHASIWAALKDASNHNVWGNLVGSGKPTNGTTGAGISGPGSSYTDYTNGVKYFNKGTKAAPIWTAISGVCWARAVFDVAVDGGEISAITPATNTVIPDNAIVMGGILDCITEPVGTNATISVGTSAGSSASSIKGATAITTFTAGALVAVVPVFTAATMFKMTADGSITVTVATTILTAGKIGIQLAYLLGE